MKSKFPAARLLLFALAAMTSSLAQAVNTALALANPTRRFQPGN